MSADSAELLDAFKAAALSVTKLYKTSTAAQSKARGDGYQDCLDDLLAFLDNEKIGVVDGDGWRIRKWITDRLEGRDAVSQIMESEDEADKGETVASSPRLQRSGSSVPPSTGRNDMQMRESAPPAVAPSTTQSVSPIMEEVEIVVPSQDTFTFQSSISYPSQESYMHIANLDLSDSQTHTTTTMPTPSTPTVRNARGRNGRPISRTTISRVHGQKRKVNLAEIFDIASLGYGNGGKDVFGNASKRSRHT
ncbi:hypothetical protein B0H66DRAFT_626043 [Apodospora peruviana]|uniref:Uncharacterized protein n=1 Tax=Apodospora peruviana TaxID=516989 RepID=A0AAE0I2Y9_9PEZI|nr:hypothetical protein B0H66DRAFT_626043 [Apodospora peruviana]